MLLHTSPKGLSVFNELSCLPHIQNPQPRDAESGFWAFLGCLSCIHRLPKSTHSSKPQALRCRHSLLLLPPLHHDVADLGTGAHGRFGICGEQKDQAPMCRCAQKFHRCPIVESLNCRIGKIPACNGAAAYVYELLSQQLTFWPKHVETGIQCGQILDRSRILCWPKLGKADRPHKTRWI